MVVAPMCAAITDQLSEGTKKYPKNDEKTIAGKRKRDGFFLYHSASSVGKSRPTLKMLSINNQISSKRVLKIMPNKITTKLDASIDSRCAYTFVDLQKS